MSAFRRPPKVTLVRHASVTTTGHGKTFVESLWYYRSGDTEGEVYAFHRALEWALMRYGDWR